MAQDQPLSIPESVSFGVSALAEDYGADVRGTCRGADDLPSLERQARETLKGSDVIVVTGGASVGERILPNHVRAIGTGTAVCQSRDQARKTSLVGDG
ncbi:MAG: hypothetical protein IPN50_09630 [Sphingomonadales bacterium]|nr:hypothetical protein [Sphingomonadales bacterium]